jgi:nitric oxide reductase NorQ protein
VAGRPAHARGEGGAICYLDEIVEARTDSTVVIHSLTDHRRSSRSRKRARRSRRTRLPAGDFVQPRLSDGAEGPQAFDQAALHRDQFRFPQEEVERKIIINEVPGVDAALAAKLVAAGRKARLLKDHGLEEATSTRALVYAANMMNAGLDPVNSCQVAMVNPITDDIELAEALMEIVKAHFS